jgi:Glu-tRNA(Gln) amidotransferase subunit E-like FAD-binding protein
MEFRSMGMFKFLGKLDDYIFQLEEDVEFLQNKKEELEKEKYERIDSDFQMSQYALANTLNAILDTPKLDVPSAITLCKIREMNSLEEIHKYIDDLIQKERNSIKESELK